MTQTERDNLVGRTATLRTKDGWDVLVTILDAREAYGRLDVLVASVTGDSDLEQLTKMSRPTRWVSADRVKVQS